jgi:amino-acid N-acetyltransferase
MPAVLSLLQGAGLPTADLQGIAGLRTWVIESQNVLRGVVALERFGTEGLLRSLAVAPEHRNRGIGRELVVRLEHDASAEGITRLVLLTETAEAFFRALGYATVDRQRVSLEMRRCAEFQSLCPASATCMAKVLYD